MNRKPDQAHLVLVGVVTGVRGLKGDLRINSFTADPEDLTAYGPLWDEAGEVSYQVRVTGKFKGHLIARIKGVSDRTAAETLKGVKLHISRSALPDPEEDEFYHSDLIGLQVVTKSGEFLGTVSAVEDFGAGDILEVASGSYKGLVVPFTKEVVPEIDLETGTVTVHPPDGLLEPPEDKEKETE